MGENNSTLDSMRLLIKYKFCTAAGLLLAFFIFSSRKCLKLPNALPHYDFDTGSNKPFLSKLEYHSSFHKMLVLYLDKNQSLIRLYFFQIYQKFLPCNRVRI